MIPAASTATSVTSASPIISAAAVDAVRCGLRRAFSRAMRSSRGPAGRPGTRAATPAPRVTFDRSHITRTISASSRLRTRPRRARGAAPPPPGRTRRSGAARTAVSTTARRGPRARHDPFPDGLTRRERAGDPRREERDSEEDQQRADPSQSRTASSRGPAEQPTGARRSRAVSRIEPACGSGRSATPAASHPRAPPRSAARASRGPPAAGSRAASPGCPTSERDDAVRVSKIRPLFGSVKPDGVEQPEEPLREARSRGRGRSPTRACRRRAPRSTIEVSTCRRDAPSVRSVANSRVRWAIVIDERVRDHERLPTKRAMPPNASRKPRRNEMNGSCPSASFFACSAAERACASAAAPRAPASGAPCPTRPASRRSRSRRARPRLPNSRCAVGRSNPARVAPPIVETLPNLTMPEIRSRCDRPVRLHADRLADLEMLLAPRSTRRSRPRSRRGHAPDDERQRVERRIAVRDAEAEVRRAAVDDALPFLPISCASPFTLPLGLGHLGQRADLREQRVVERRRRDAARRRGRRPPCR